MSRSIAAESEQHYILWKVRYPDARAEDMRRRQAEVEHSTAWALARNEAARRLSLDLPYSPTSPDVDDYKCVGSSDDELFGSDS